MLIINELVDVSQNLKKIAKVKKGDCIILECDTKNYVLILHHTIVETNKTEHGFIVIGKSFEKTPSIIEIELSGVLGDKYQNDTVDLMNSGMRSRQKYDKSTFYTGIKYDVIIIPQSLFNKEESRIKIIGNLDINPEFYPMPNFYSRQNNYDDLCELIESRISKKDSKKISWGKIYDAYPVKEILE